MKLNTKNPEVIIICGNRRSGTTLLNAILCSDPRSNKLGQEAQLLTRLIESYKWSKCNFNNFGSSFFSSKKALKSFYQKTVNSFIHEISLFCSKGLLVLKNPELIFVAQELLELLPSAHFILQTRDPRDQISSEFEVQNNRINDGISSSNWPDDVKSYIDNYLRYRNCIESLDRNNYKNVLKIDYEDLILNFEEVILKIQKKLNLSLNFNPEYNWNNISKKANLQNFPCRSPNYGKPITKTSVFRYKNDLTKQQISLIEFHCKEYLTLENFSQFI